MHELELRACFTRAGLNSVQQDHVVRMIADSPIRRLGKGALDNVVVQMWSQKNQSALWLESHTVERLFAYELEFDPDVVAYFTQVPCRAIERYSEQGRRHVGNATADFLVVRQDSVYVVECKTSQRVESLLQRHPEDWRRSVDGVIERPAFTEWASKNGIDYRVWVQPEIFAYKLANFELLYFAGHVEEIQRSQNQALRLLEGGPRTVRDLMTSVPGLTARQIHELLRSSLVFGPIGTQLIDHTDTFLLFRDREQCQMTERSTLSSIERRFDSCTDAISSATYRDLCKGRERLSCLRSMQRAERPFTRRYRALEKRVASAIAEGRSELEACLTSYHTSGNRIRRLPFDVEQEISCALRRWEQGQSHDKETAYIELVAACNKKGLTPPSQTTLNRRLKLASATKRALSSGGIRNYQKTRASTDPRRRSLSSLAVGLRLHIDSTQVDNRVFPGVEDKLLIDRPIIYVAIDNATSDPDCCEIGFGPARSDAVAALLRTYVRIHGRLPEIIQVDRGTENTSRWLRKFCETYRIFLFVHPTAGSVFNSAAENWIGRINSCLHRLPGSTLPDQRGRSVDGRFKSRRTASLQFSVLGEIVRASMADLRHVPGQDGESPAERREALLEATGMAGHLTSVDEEFLFQTSIPVSAKSANLTRGVKLKHSYYSSSELLSAIRSGDIQEIRYDCDDPTIIRVQTTVGRHKAWSSLAPKFAHLTQLDAKFAAYYLHQRQGSIAARRMQSRIENHAHIEHIRSRTSLPPLTDLRCSASPGDVERRPSAHVDLALDLNLLQVYSEDDDHAG